MDRPGQQPLITARARGLVGCRCCGVAVAATTPRCPRCEAPLRGRDPHSLQKVMAWMIAGIIAYIPANTYPMLRTTQAFQTTDATIVGGVVDLVHHHAYAVAAIVFVASVVIPVGKFLAIGYLAWALSRARRVDPHRLHLLYEIVEFIGRWSMIDVFVVAILVALVQFDVVATIQPGIAAVCFALSVVFTMVSAQSFETRAIWDRMGSEGSDVRP